MGIYQLSRITPTRGENIPSRFAAKVAPAPAPKLRGTISMAKGPAMNEEPPPKENKREERTEKSAEVFPSSPATLDAHTPGAELATAANPRKPFWRRFLSGIQWFIIDQWFLIGICCLVLISSQVQVPAPHQQKKELVCTYLCVAVIFIVTGCTLPTKVVLENYGRWKLHLFVQSQTFLMTSAVAYAVVSICATNPRFLDPALLVGMIFTGCVPTTISSNVVMTRQAHGNTALTVVQSTLGNFLGPFISPLLIIMYTSSGAWYTTVLPPTSTGEFSKIYRRVYMQLGLSIFLPMAVGQVIQNIFPKATKKVFVDWKLNKLSPISLMIVIWQTFDSAFATGAFTSVKGNNMVFIVFISIAFFLSWGLICVMLSVLWLGKQDTIAVAYCVPAKTLAMGVPLSTVMYSGLSTLTKSKIQIPMIIFQGFQVAGGSLLTIAFRKWIRPDEERGHAKKAEQEDNAARHG